MILRLATRGSALALWQANLVKERLLTAHPPLHIELQILHTTGDRSADAPLTRIGERGLFTKQLDRAVLDGHASAAVHSLKDLPTVLEDGLALAAVLERGDARDVYLPAPGRPARLLELPAGARVGTSSLRRRAQLLHARPDLLVADLRGNLDTRLKRVAAGVYDGAIVAAAGIRRLGREDAIGQVLEPPAWLPAAGQGAIAVVARDDDAELRAILSLLDHRDTRLETTAERVFLRALEGGCQIPIGALATTVNDALGLSGFVASLDGRALLRGEMSGEPEAAEAIGRRLADELLAAGAAGLLEQIRGTPAHRIPEASAP